jgi:hypothetical protein
VPAAISGRRAEQQAGTRQRLGVRVVLRDRLLDQPEGLVRLGPTVQGRERQATPPALVLEAGTQVWWPAARRIRRSRLLFFVRTRDRDL